MFLPLYNLTRHVYMEIDQNPQFNFWGYCSQNHKYDSCLCLSFMDGFWLWNLKLNGFEIVSAFVWLMYAHELCEGFVCSYFLESKIEVWILRCVWILRFEFQDNTCIAYYQCVLSCWTRIWYRHWRYIYL
jgi:hypothetical protein